MAKILFLKSHVKAHTRKDGIFVKDYETKKQPSLFGSAPKKPPEGYHPKADDKGKKVGIDKLSKPTDPLAFDDHDEIATFVPGSETPHSLGGVAFASWADAPTTVEGWADVEGQNVEHEPPMPELPDMKVGAGVVIQEDDGRVWVVHPTNSFGGYNATFPKGTVEDGLSLQASAIKEAFEESGLKVELVAHLKDVVRTTSVARYYVARRVGGTPSDMGWESQACSLVPVSKLFDVLNMSTDHGIATLLGAKK